MSATARRVTLERLLESRKLDGTLLRPWMQGDNRAVSTGFAALDEALGGGWQAGEMSEIVGTRSAGRTGTVQRTLAVTTGRGDLAAVVDAFDRFDARSAAAAGVDLTRVLWVRGPACTVELASPAVLDRAVHQAIRAFDLINRAGGFALTVLDLGDVPARVIRGLPAATWLRLARAIEGRETMALVIGEAPMGRSARGATVRLESARRWAGNSPQSRRFAGFTVRGTVSQSWRSPVTAPVWQLDAGAVP